MLDVASRTGDDDHHYTPWGAGQHVTRLVLHRQPSPRTPLTSSREAGRGDGGAA
jgi:hypothetical protein